MLTPEQWIEQRIEREPLPEGMRPVAAYRPILVAAMRDAGIAARVRVDLVEAYYAYHHRPAHGGVGVLTWRDLLVTVTPVWELTSRVAPALWQRAALAMGLGVATVVPPQHRLPPVLLAVAASDSLDALLARYEAWRADHHR